MKHVPERPERPELIPAPAFYWNPKTKLATLREDVDYETPILGQRAALPRATLSEDGALAIADGFEWDLGSGPVFNTPGLIYASLAHDVFYLMMQADRLPWSLREEVDDFFLHQMKRFGSPWFRRWRRYWAVRLLYPAWSWLGKVFS